MNRYQFDERENMRRMKRVMALGLLAAAAACGDGSTEPVEPVETVEGLLTQDSVVMTAIRDTVTLTAELVYSSGNIVPASDVAWSGCGADVALLSVEGLLETVSPGTCQAVAAWGDYRDTVTVAVRRRGILTITFDDGWKSAYNVGLPVLADAGLLGNVAVVPGTVGWPAYLTVEQMHALDAAGWSLVSQGMTHDSLRTLTPEELVEEITGPVQWLQERELRTADVLVVPYHDWGEREREIIQAEFAAARGREVDWFWPEFMADWRPEDPYAITCIDGSTLSRTAAGRDSAMAYVETAVTEGRLLDIMFHNVAPEDEAGFRALIAELERYADRVRTWSEIYPLPDTTDADPVDSP